MTLCQEYCEGDVLYGTGLSGDLVVVSSSKVPVLGTSRIGTHVVSF